MERARQKRQVEASLPPLDSDESFQTRKKILQQQDELEWKYREEQIRK
jgi:hypothetical protein